MKRKLNFTVETQDGKESYELSIPTAGQLVRIETVKASTSGNTYGGIFSSGTVGGNYALDIIDMNAYLSVLCPDLIQSLKTKSLFDLDVFDLKQIKDAYDSQVVPWIIEWQTALSKSPVEIDKSKEEKS